jgi:DNA modification methylase
MVDWQTQVNDLTQQFEAATQEYRAVMQDHLSLRGVKRDAHKPRLESALENMKSLEERLLCAKLQGWQSQLTNNNLTFNEKSKLQRACDDARKQLQKLQSRLTHEEWLAFTRSVWGFKETESDAKTGMHPAQFSAVIPYRLIKMYSYVGETVLDPFTGTGTTLIEARRLRRHSIGIDLNPEFIELTQRRLRGAALTQPVAEGTNGRLSEGGQLTLALRETAPVYGDEQFEPVLIQEDARSMHSVADNSIQLVVTHPPYWNAVQISDLSDDLSSINDYSAFLREMTRVFEQVRRVLQPDRVFAIVTGDVMRKVDEVTQLFPLHADYIQILRNMGFVLWDLFIWETKIRLSGGKPMMGSYPYPHKLFSQFAHNYVLVFRKLP